MTVAERERTAKIKGDLKGDVIAHSTLLRSRPSPRVVVSSSLLLWSVQQRLPYT